MADTNTNGMDVNGILSNVLNNIASNMSNASSFPIRNLRTVLNPGDPPMNNDNYIDSESDDELSNNVNINYDDNRNTMLDDVFLESDGRGGFNPVSLLPPVLKSCNALNLELDRIVNNYNEQVLKHDNMDEDVNDDVDDDDDVTGDSTNVPLTNNVSSTNQRFRREYLNQLNDVWMRMNRIVFNDEQKNDDQNIWQFVHKVFQELNDFQIAIEQGINNPQSDIQMKDESINDTFNEEMKKGLEKRTASAGCMLIEIGTVLASMGHTLSKLDINRSSPNNRLRLPRMTRSHVVRSAVPVEVSAIVTNLMSLPTTTVVTSNTTTTVPTADVPITDATTNESSSPWTYLPQLPTTVDGNQNTSSAQNTNNNNNNTTSDANNNPFSMLTQLLGNANNNTSNNPLSTLINAFTTNNNSNPMQNTANTNNVRDDTNNIRILRHILSFMLNTFTINDLNNARDGNLSFLIKYRKIVNEFVLKELLHSTDTPMRRHSMAMGIADAMGAFMISEFGDERRQTICNLTQKYFANHMPPFLDLLLDESMSDESYVQQIEQWCKRVFGEWIYKLSLNYTNRITDVQKLFTKLLLYSLGSILENESEDGDNNMCLKLIPEFVKHFVNAAKAFHMKQLQNRYSTNSFRSVHEYKSDTGSRTARNLNNTQQMDEPWVKNLPSEERNRWLETIQSDRQRMKQSVHDMKDHAFSANYQGPKTIIDELFLPSNK